MYNIYPWQQKQWQYLLARRANGNLPHSLLLTGQQGLGGTDFALAFTALLLCENQEEFACGNCKACKLVQAGNHPDLNLLQPEAKDKAIKVDQIRNIIDIVARKSHQGGYQIVIIEPADNMNIAAANALLKTLEEPPGEVIIMLITDRISLLPATIRSRCQQIVFQAPEAEVTKLWLNEDVSNNFANLISRKITALKFAELCSSMDTRVVLGCIQLLLTDMMRTKIGQPGETDVLFRCYDKITNLMRFDKNNLNKQLLFEDLGLYLEGMLHAN